MFIGALLALPLYAASLAVNETTTGTLLDSQELTLPAGTTVAPQATVVISATMKFTLPSETPLYSNYVTDEDKLVIMADTTGALLIADTSSGTGAWKNTGISISESDTVQVKAIGTPTDAGKLTFDVQLTVGATEKTVTILSPATNTTLSTLAFEGMGEASNVSVALAPTTIVPTGDASQDAALVSAYAEWINTAGATLGDVDDATQQDAFAMNVGGLPKLEITEIDPVEHTITVKGSYTTTTGEVEADLKTINGKLYITYAATLDGTPTTQVVPLSVVQGNLAIIPIPEGAQFIKAHVALTEPVNKL